MTIRRSVLRLAVAAAALACVLTVPVAARATTVTAPVSADTTWTAAGNPWIIAADIEVANGARLVLEPGVEVQGGGHRIEVHGDLDASGSPLAPVFFTDTHVVGKGTFVPTSTVETFTVSMRNCDVTGGSLQGGGASMYGWWVLEDSVVVNVDQSMYLWFPRGDCRIERNVFVNAGKIDAATAFGNVLVTNNLFWRPWAGIESKDSAIQSWQAFDGYGVIARRNSFLTPGLVSARVPDWAFTGSLDAVSNWWTTTSADEVSATMVFDRGDTLDAPAFVEHLPLLDAPDPLTPTAGTAGTVLPLVSTVQLGATATTVPVGGTTTLTVTLADARGRVMPHERVVVERSADGSTWSEVASATLVTSTGTFSVTVPASSLYRARFDGVAGIYTPATSAVTTVSAPAATMVRIAGADRYEVAYNAAAAAYPGWAGITDVVIACGSDRAMADPLTASGLTGLYRAPLLLVRTDTRVLVPPQTLAALRAIQTANGRKPNLHIVGGPASVTLAHVNALVAYDYDRRIDRIGGLDRYEVAAGVAARMRSTLGAAAPKHAFLTNGQYPVYFWNALAAAPASGRMRYPILITKASAVPPSIRAALSNYTTVTVVGLPADTPTAVVSVAMAKGASLERVSGSDRYATAESFARLARERGWLGAADRVAVGNKIADSLTGGAAMAVLGGPLLYSPETTLASPTGTHLAARSTSIRTCYVLGGTASMPTTVWNAIAAKLGIAP